MLNQALRRILKGVHGGCSLRKGNDAVVWVIYCIVGLRVPSGLYLGWKFGYSSNEPESIMARDSDFGFHILQ